MDDLSKVRGAKLEGAMAQMIGPERRGHSVIVGGREVPRLHCHRVGDDIDFVLDGRFGCTVPIEYALPVAAMIANALAIGQGYPSYAAVSKDQPFAPEVIELSEISQ